jgi:hypothetical protein
MNDAPEEKAALRRLSNANLVQLMKPRSMQAFE